AALTRELAAIVDQGAPTKSDNASLRVHPLAVWIELEIGLHDREKLSRREPATLASAAARLAEQTGREPAKCAAALRGMLMLMNRPEKERGGTGDTSFLAFKLHRFISGAGHVHATLRRPGQRKVRLEGQQFHPDDREARLYPTYFCRVCGQEHHPVTIVEQDGRQVLLPRSIDDMPIDDDSEEARPGFLMPEPTDDEFDFAGAPEDYPESWIELGPGGQTRLRANRRRQVARKVSVAADGSMGAGELDAWFLPGRFAFCPTCRDTPAPQARDINKLAGLSAEGRSSATTILIASALRWMNRAGSEVPTDKRKLLDFTDNRQDAALQAGHFNDFVFVTLLRAAMLRAVEDAGDEGLGDDRMGRRVQEALGFLAGNVVRRGEWLPDPGVKGMGLVDAERALARVLAHRAWADQRLGWRFTNPNLEEVGLLRADYPYLEELLADASAFNSAPPHLSNASAETRRAAMLIVMEHMRRGLAVATEALDGNSLDQLAQRSRSLLRPPWGFGQEEEPRAATWLIVDAPGRGETSLRAERMILRGGARGRIGRELRAARLWGERLSLEECTETIEALLEAARTYGLVRKEAATFGDVSGWRLEPSAIVFKLGQGRQDQRPPNRYFVELYKTLAAMLADGGEGLFGLEAREHTAQVEQSRREFREWRFRNGDDDRKRIAENAEAMRQAGEPTTFLPALVCSPTMELGVDISALNAVYLRNVPPTPANYAQRSGRAGRSGQAAYIVTYCAAQSPHDQYFFRSPEAMVAGIVRAPTLELSNQDLIESHLHALWLSETKAELSADIAKVLDLQQVPQPLRSDIQQKVSAPSVLPGARMRMRRLLGMVADALSPENAPWAGDLGELAGRIAAAAPKRFDDAFERWRDLYAAARRQMDEANRIQNRPGVSRQDRDEARRLYNQSVDQLKLLEAGSERAGADFFTYRYLATEGFLPGYNFPRLPLLAYVPGQGDGQRKPTYLQRARFVAISEFGPLSLVYHEGRAYRVFKAMLPPAARSPDGRGLATWTIWPCGVCGAGHERKEPERCHACGAPMGGVLPIHNALRIDNVETTPTERITSNDEERQRQGFDLQTLFAWTHRDGRLDVRRADARDAAGAVARLDFGASARIQRVNKGLRRRKSKNVYGFPIDPASGRWAGKADDPGMAENGPDKAPRQRIVPVVEDRKNALLLRLASAKLSQAAMATLQHALARGLELVFQLEEGEVLTEATPSRDHRSAILFYEATEGGAGVLARLVSRPMHLAEVARAALHVMHYDLQGRAPDDTDPASLAETDSPACVVGCYRCLLSYYNQPDHELIDRTNAEALGVLLRLARSQVTPAADTPTAAADETAKAGVWRRAIVGWGLPAPDGQPFVAGAQRFDLAWRDLCICANFGALAAGAVAAAADLGFTAIELPERPGDLPPAALIDALGGDNG
ncbi:MAG: DUF1998 domain-containing protein, partial [Alphaproteobacteria bacterium]|nr:DUF1998 domain-containing protein [Alphaproteobacteria bacterium]